MRLTRLMSAALVAVVAGVAGCSGADTVVSFDGGSLNSIGAAFTLESVNGHALPAELRHDATGTLSVTRGQLFMGSGTFQQVLTLYETSATSSMTSTRDAATQGTFTLRGDQIHFQASDGGQWDGTYSGTKVEYAVIGNSGSVTFTFVRS
ncbi:MAG TPA: hypothetical protein VF541_07050 [Longimicrobium sp.]|jgi:hypothetical protein